MDRYKWHRLMEEAKVFDLTLFQIDKDNDTDQIDLPDDYWKPVVLSLIHRIYYVAYIYSTVSMNRFGLHPAGRCERSADIELFDNLTFVPLHY